VILRSVLAATIRETFEKFFRDRGTHLAAMIAYFALLSFFPLTFLAFAILGLTGRADESSYVVTELKRAFPGASISQLVRTVRTVQDNATALGIVGGVTLLWASLSLFSALESAFNIVYDRPNRPFLRGKALAIVFMSTGLIVLFVGLLAGSFGFDILKRYASGFAGNPFVAYTLSVSVSTIAVFLFLFAAYYRLTNVPLRATDVLPGTAIATIGLETTFQILPIYLRLSNNVPAAQAFGGPVILLIWLYVMAVIIVFGAEVNYTFARRAVRESAVVGLA
jgi:membrane protein